MFESAGSTERFNYFTEPLLGSGFGKNFVIEIVLPVSELQQVSHRIFECADPNLNGAAISDERTDVERDHVLGCVHTAIRRAKERESIFRVFDDTIKVIAVDRGIAVHKWEIVVYLGQQRNLRPLAFRIAQARCKVHREVRITTEAVTSAAVRLHFAD